MWCTVNSIYKSVKLLIMLLIRGFYTLGPRFPLFLLYQRREINKSKPGWSGWECGGKAMVTMAMVKIWILPFIPYCKQNHFYEQICYSRLYTKKDSCSLLFCLARFFFVAVTFWAALLQYNHVANCVRVEIGGRYGRANAKWDGYWLKWHFVSPFSQHFLFFFSSPLFIRISCSSCSFRFQVEFSADTLRLNLIDLARTGSKFIQVAGRVAYTCPAGDPQDPVTFTTRDSHLVSILFHYIALYNTCCVVAFKELLNTPLRYKDKKKKIDNHHFDLKYICEKWLYL